METTPCRHSSLGSNYRYRFVDQCQALGGGIEASNCTANLQPQHRPNANVDFDPVGKMHPPGAGQQHQQQQLARQQPQGISSQSHLPMHTGSQPSSDCSGPPPVQPTTPHDMGSGHPVKRVSTDTLLPPHTRRRITGKTGPRQN